MYKVLITTYAISGVGSAVSTTVIDFETTHWADDAVTKINNRSLVYGIHRFAERLN